MIAEAMRLRQADEAAVNRTDETLRPDQWLAADRRHPSVTVSRADLQEVWIEA